jgi:predicted CoA-substrate-specific enzyme activase
LITVGVDIGSISTKAALVKDGNMVESRLIPTGYHAGRAAEAVFSDLLAHAGLGPGQVDRVVATGYGRKRAGFAHRAVTEISCHGAGARHLLPQVRSVIDIGGQDSKIILLEATGKVADFVMNDKCAAGTGRFLEVMARALETDLADFGSMAMEADRPARISSLCTVFAESEVISLIAGGERRRNIIAGIHDAIAARVVAMAGRLRLSEPIMMTGGVARNTGVVAAMERQLGVPVRVMKEAQITGALGAALIAAKDLAAPGD